jgi:hypothetical protein
MQSFRVRYGLTFLALLAISGCKVTITSPEGGSVVSQSGAYTCTAASPCEIDILDATFNEVFVPVPDSGFAFTQWKDSAGHFCRGNSLANCRISTLLLAGNADAIGLLALGFETFLEPEFAIDMDAVATNWTGTWEVTNGTTALDGDISLDIQPVNEETYAITLDLGGSIGGIVDPSPQTVTVPVGPDGSLAFSGNIDLGGQNALLTFSLAAGGQVAFAINSIPQQAFNSIQASGFLGESSGELGWAITLADGVRIKGNAAVSRG